MNRPLAAALAAIAAFFGLGAARAMAPMATPAQPPAEPPAPEPSAPEQAATQWPGLAALLPAASMPATGYTAPDVEAVNIRAFGQAVALAEGTAKGPNQGYDVLFGWPMKGRTFDAAAAADHPRIRFYEQADEFLANGKKDFTTAAGRYQITQTTYDDMRRRYGIPPGFTPALQERHFEALLAETGALKHVKAGRIPTAIVRARSRWASLPGANTPQPQRSEQYVLAAYTAAGGTLA